MTTTAATALGEWLAATERTVEPGDKGWPPTAWGLDAPRVRELGLGVRDLPTPAVTVDRDALRHNVGLFAGYCRDRAVDLAPHAKTAMAPLLVRLQLEAGAWGMTAATWRQARLLQAMGCRRVLVANQLLDPVGLRLLANAAREGAAEVLCYVDSLEGIALMERALAGEPGDARVGVLVEVGLAGGRTGVRGVRDALELARAVERSPRLRLRGIAGYEGIRVDDRSEPELAAVREFLAGVRTVAERLLDDGRFPDGEDVLVTAGGSTLFDEVVAALGGLAGPGVRVVLRSGCYAFHDSGFYDRLSPLAGAGTPGGRLRPALTLWSRVLSRPEATRAVADFGKRDTSADLGLPVVRRVLRGGAPATGGGEAARVAELFDQHALLDVAPGDPLAPGDVLDCGVSHPCTTLDRWRTLAVVEDDRVVDVMRTYF